MSARSTPAPTTVKAQPAAKPDAALHRLRQVCIALAVVCAAALPFELGVLNLTASALERLPLVSIFFPPPPPPRILSVHNFPRTAVVGRTERFSVRLAGMSHAWLTYVLRYPDGSEDRARVRADAHGYSSHTFRVVRYRPRHFREVATIGVLDRSGRLHAFKRFAIQQP